MNATAHPLPLPVQAGSAALVRSVLPLCLVLPWLQGVTAGPSPNFWPLWFAAVMGVTVLLMWRHVDARVMARAWLAAALLSSLLALLQYFGWVAKWTPWVSASEIGQAYGNLRQRNQFASLTSIGLVCLLVLATGRGAMPLTGKIVGKRSPALFVLPAAALVLALGNAASSSRTGFLQWLLIFVVLLSAWVWQGRPRRGALAAATALALGASFAYVVLMALLPRALLAWQHIDIGTMAERLAGAGQDSRLVLWDNVLHLIAQKPWLGWGWGELDYAHFVTLYPGARFTELLDNAHNLPLQLAVELGLPLALLVVVGVLAWVFHARPWLERDPGRQLAWGVLAVIGVHSLLEYPLWYGPFHWTALFCVLWLWRPRLAAPRLAFGLAMVCLPALAFVALDYVRVSQRYVPAAERSSSPWLKSATTSVFFQAPLDFARLTTTPLSMQNAGEVHELALGLLHYSPEARVVEPLIASAFLLGRDEVAAFYLLRYRAAFPDALADLLQRHPGWAQHLTP